MGQAARKLQTEIEHRAFGLLEVKLDDEAGKVSGYGAMFGNTDSYGDVIERGAFAETLKEWRAKGKYPPMLLQHGGGFGGGADDMLPIGKWTHMEENSKGLKVEGQLFALGTERGQYIYEGLKSGVLDGLSIGFVAREVRFGEGKDEPARTLTDIDLWEVSIVTFPANDKARVTGVKNRILTVDEIRDLEGVLREAGLSRADCGRAVSAVKSWLRRDAGAPANTPRDADVSEAAVLSALRNLYR